MLPHLVSKISELADGQRTTKRPTEEHAYKLELGYQTHCICKFSCSVRFVMMEIPTVTEMDKV